MSNAIWLIVEDETDADIVKALLKARHLAVRVKWRGEGGIGKLAKDIENHIQTFLIDKDKSDCIVVLHDADRHHQSDRSAYDRIAEVCQRYRSDVKHIIAHDAIEAWLLADEGICKWLETTPKNHDTDTKPKEELIHLLKERKKLRWQGQHRKKVLDHLSGRTHSAELESHFAYLSSTPCIKA